MLDSIYENHEEKKDIPTSRPKTTPATSFGPVFAIAGFPFPNQLVSKVDRT